MALDTSLRVLVAEDNPNLRKVIVNVVKKLGFTQVEETEDGDQTWERIQSGEIGLVLADWKMPGPSGLELLQRVRKKDFANPQLPFVIVTASDTKEAILTAAKAGVDAYVIKPFSVTTIQEKITEALAKRST